MKSKKYTAGTLRLLGAGLINNHEFSPEARQTAGQALLDYAERLDALARGGRKAIAPINERKRAAASTEPAAVKRREQMARYRAKKAALKD